MNQAEYSLGDDVPSSVDTLVDYPRSSKPIAGMGVTRAAVLSGILSGQFRSLAEIAEALNIRPPAVSYHFRNLCVDGSITAVRAERLFRKKAVTAGVQRAHVAGKSCGPAKVHWGTIPPRVTAGEFRSFKHGGRTLGVTPGTFRRGIARLIQHGQLPSWAWVRQRMTESFRGAGKEAEV